MENKQLDTAYVDRVEDLTYSPLEKNYLKVLYCSTAFIYLLLMGCTLLLLLIEKLDSIYVAYIECLLLAICSLNLNLLPKAFAQKGFALRQHDVTYRRGIFFPTVTTIPFRKIQQVSIRQNLLTKQFNLYTVHIENGAQLSSSVSIPGLTESAANAMKALLIERISHEK